MKQLKSILIVIFFISIFSSSLIAQDVAPSLPSIRSDFSADTFIKVLSRYLDNHSEFNREETQRRLSSSVVRAKRILLAEKILKDEIDVKPTKVIKQLQNFALYGHSVALFDKSRWNQIDKITELTPLQRLLDPIIMGRLFSFNQPTQKWSDRKDLLEFFQSQSSEGRPLIWYKCKSCAQYKESVSIESLLLIRPSLERASGPVIEWLLAKPKHSVSEWQLLKQALEIYEGDLLTSLAVIGTLFHQEAMFVKDREAEAVLGTRMKPLLRHKGHNHDDIGQNYAFWTHLNLALMGKGVSADIHNIVHEKYITKDYPDYVANALGIQVGAKLRQYLK